VISSLAIGAAVAIALLVPARADAQWRYPYPYPYGGYARSLASVRVLVTPKEAQVYVDGYYAGIVDDFDGLFQRLHVPAGEHEFVLYLDGYRTVHQKVYLTPDATYKLRYTMEKNLAGEASEPPPAPPEPNAAGPGAAPQPYPPAPRAPRRPMYPPPQPYPYPPQPPYPEPQPPQPPTPPQPPQPPSAAAPAPASDSGTLIVRVQPSGSDVTIDGEQWRGPEGDERLVVQVDAGSHHIEVRKNGFRRYAGDVQVRRGETVPVNVSLSPERDEQ
jgi:hypothetical protein